MITTKTPEASSSTLPPEGKKCELIKSVSVPQNRTKTDTLVAAVGYCTEQWNIPLMTFIKVVPGVALMSTEYKGN